jgi:hypothetical protein
MPHFLEMIRHELTKVADELIPLQNRATILSKKKALLETFLDGAAEVYPDIAKELKRESIHAQYTTGTSLSPNTGLSPSTSLAAVQQLPATNKRKPLHAPGLLAAAVDFFFTAHDSDVLTISDIAEYLVGKGHYPDVATAKRNIGVFLSRSDKYVRVSSGTYRKRIGDATIGEIVGAKSKTL